MSFNIGGKEPSRTHDTLAKKREIPKTVITRNRSLLTLFKALIVSCCQSVNFSAQAFDAGSDVAKMRS